MVKFLVAIGTYERVLYGIDVEVSVENASEPSLLSVKNTFAIPAHTASIRSIASCPRFLASGGADESIRLFDLRRRRDIGTLSEHNGSVSALAFWHSSHLLSAAEDGQVGLYRTSDWETLQVWKHGSKNTTSSTASHSTSLAVHPSGKVAISASADGKIKLWNLVTGKPASTDHVPKHLVSSKGTRSCDLLRIQWSQPLGSFYGIIFDGGIVLVYRSASSSPWGRYQTPNSARLNAIAFFRDRFMLCAGEGSKLYIFDLQGQDADTSIEKPIALQPFRSYDLSSTLPTRIKDVSVTELEDSVGILSAGSSDGTIAGWSLSTLLASIEAIPTPLFTHQASGFRITCLTSTILENKKNNNKQ